MLLKSDVKTFDEALTGESRQAGRGVICKVQKSNFARRQDCDGRKLKLKIFFRRCRNNKPSVEPEQN